MMTNKTITMKEVREKYKEPTNIYGYIVRKTYKVPGRHPLEEVYITTPRNGYAVQNLSRTKTLDPPPRTEIMLKLENI